ncbi:hypothetical protein DF182_14200 [Chitinophaga flava]|uniref:Uncharacterized protein n=1 Tax=Chitinophaga flava TaxID=2259036 RepID=A0A365Y4Y7_9BACT|nr:hypothetical protein DF182_14200 [Chitinophaga flava]
MDALKKENHAEVAHKNYCAVRRELLPGQHLSSRKVMVYASKTTEKCDAASCCLKYVCFKVWGDAC